MLHLTALAALLAVVHRLSYWHGYRAARREGLGLLRELHEGWHRWRRGPHRELPPRLPEWR